MDVKPECTGDSTEMAEQEQHIKPRVSIMRGKARCYRGKTKARRYADTRVDDSSVRNQEFVYVVTDQVEAQVDETTINGEALIESEVVLDCDSNVTQEPKKEHRCQTCSAVFKSNVMLRRHMRASTGCNSSKKRSTLPNNVTSKNTNENNKVDGSPEKSHKCETCSKTFTSRRGMLLHKKHDCGRLEPHMCETCSRTFKARTAMLAHKRYDCGLPEPIKCEKCNKIFATTRGKLLHIKHDCGREEPHKCEMCDRPFNTRSAMISHMKNDCGRQERYQCDKCKKTFKARSTMLSHMKHGCGPRERHKCGKCDKTYSTRGTMLTHMKRDCNRKEPHKCEKCGKTFKIWKNLVIHTKYDCELKEPHKCDSCGKTFNSIGGMLTHKRHDCGRQEKHMCDSCGMAFKHWSGLVTHMKHDCGRQEPHECEWCDKPFRSWSNLRSHMKRSCIQRKYHEQPQNTMIVKFDNSALSSTIPHQSSPVKTCWLPRKLRPGTGIQIEIIDEVVHDDVHGPIDVEITEVDNEEADSPVLSVPMARESFEVVRRFMESVNNLPSDVVNSLETLDSFFQNVI